MLLGFGLTISENGYTRLSISPEKKNLKKVLENSKQARKGRDLKTENPAQKTAIVFIDYTAANNLSKFNTLNIYVFCKITYCTNIFLFPATINQAETFSQCTLGKRY